MMSKTRFLLPLILALTTCWASNPIFDDVPPQFFQETLDNLPSFRLPEDIKPTHYNITLKPVFNTSKDDNFTFAGESVINLNVVNNTDRIIFHAKNLNISFPPLVESTVTNQTITVSKMIKDEVEERDFITLILENKVNMTDLLTLTLEFTGILNDDLRGFYRSSYKDDTTGEEIWLGTTQFEPVGARLAFPCWDEPGIKATFTITIVTPKSPVEYHAISNMKINTTTKETPDNTTIFNTSPKMSSYLVAFVVSNFENNTNKDKDFTVWAKPQAFDSTHFALDIGQRVLKQLENYTEIEYKNYQGMQKIDQISIPDFAAGAMENWGLVTYRESALLYTDNKTTTENRQSIATVIAHEFSHQWFGNLVTCKWWDSIWLNEGFATFFQYFTTDKIMKDKSEDWRLMEQFAIKNLQASAFVVDASSKTRALHPKNSAKTPAQISSLFDDIAYKKGASIIRMMQQILGEKVFQEGLKHYLTIHSFNAVNSEDLLEAIQNKTEDVEFKTVMKNWIYEPGYPVITVTRFNDTHYNLTQNRFFLVQPTNPDKTEWHIHVDYVTQDEINDEIKGWLKPGETLLIPNDIKTNNWVLLNKDQTGYYRVNYNEENWKRLAAFLKTENGTHISAVNRAQLIDDALNLARGGYLQYDVALSITEYLSTETDYIPWYAAVRAFNYLDNVLQNSTADYHGYVANKIAAFAQSVEYENPYDGTHVEKLAKVLALNTACKYGLKACNEFAVNELNEYLNNAKTLPADLRSGILCAGLRTANNETLQKALEKLYKNATKDEQADILAGLGCITSEEVVNEFLKSTLDTDLLYDALNSVCTSNTASFNILIKFIVENIQKIQQNPEVLAAHFNKLANRITTTEQYIELMSLVTKVLSEEVQKTSLDAGLANALENIAWIKRHREEVAKWIEDNSKEQPEPTTSEPDSANSLTLTFFLVWKRRAGMMILKLSLLNVSYCLIYIASLHIIPAFVLNLENESNGTVIYRLPDNVVPIHYNIKVIPYIEENNFTFDGETNIRIEIRRVTKYLSLHALNLMINETATTLVNNDGVIYTPKVNNYNNITNILVLNFDVELPLGIYTLNMRFVGILHNDLHGFFRTLYINEEGKKVWLAVSHFEATWARRAFPCWDEPALKATFNISIKHHRNYTALSNMPIREQSEDGNENDTIWTHFDTTPVMSTYLVTFVVADYVRVPNKDGTVNMWCRPALAPYSIYAQKIAEQAQQLLTEYTNSTIKVPKMDHVAVPQFRVAGAMENWGIIVHSEDTFTYREGIDPIQMKLWVAIVAAHEMAHQWFGNVVSPSWWSHVWLNEGLASFFEKYILDQIYKDWRMMEYFVVKIQQTALHGDVAKLLNPVIFEVNSPHEIDSLFSASIYAKAPAILRMLQHILTNEVFQEGIIRYLHTHQFSSVTSDNLWSALQAALDESNVPHNAYELKEVMDTWIKQRNYPVVHVIRNNDTGEVILTQEHFMPSNKDIDNNKWWIPVTFATQTNPDFSNTLPTHWLRPQDQSIIIDGINPNDWIIVNLQQTGYYRVNYDLSNWKKITAYLKSSNYTKIHVLNRAQIIDDAYHLTMTKQLDISTFLDLMTYLAQETDYIAWYPMFEIFNISEEFYNLAEAAIIKSHLLEILKGLVESVGFEEDPMENDFTKIKRVTALKWACTFGHSECKKMATIKLSEHLANPEIHKVSPNLKEWVYCNGIMEANETIWNKLMDVYVNKSDEDILDYLACSENPDILIKFLNISASHDSIIKNKHYKDAYGSILQKHANNDLVLDYVLMNLNKTISKGIDIYTLTTAIINAVHFNGSLDKISKSVKSNFHEEKILKHIEKEIKKRKNELLQVFSAFQLPVHR
nr:PREDICTED: uncharacterized protein LOC105677005 [Linepithema humile]